MKRVINKLSLTLVLVLALSQVFFIAYADSAPESSTRLYVEGKLVDIPEKFGEIIVSNGRTFLPVRAIADALWLPVRWVPEEKTVIFNNDIKLKPGSDTIETPSGSYKMDVEVISMDGRVYVPIRFISEVLGYKITWDMEGGYSNIYITGTKKVKFEDAVKEEENMYVVDTSKLVAPTYNNGYSQIDVWDNYIGFNELSNVGVRTSNTTHEEDIKHFNKTIMNNTLMNFSSWGYLDTTGNGLSIIALDMLDATLKVQRDNDNNPNLFIPYWALYDFEFYHIDSRRYTATMNAAAEILRYYTGRDADAKAIWAFLYYKAKEKENIDFSKDYLFGETKIRFIKPNDGKIQIVILN